MSLLLLLLSVQPPATAPEPPLRRFTDAVEVAEVVVHAVVTDRAGRPVLGLEPADFLVREEGRPVEVTSAVYHPWGRVAATPRAMGDGAVELPEIGGGRLFIFLFHDLRRTDRETLGEPSAARGPRRPRLAARGAGAGRSGGGGRLRLPAEDPPGLHRRPRGAGSGDRPRGRPRARGAGLRRRRSAVAAGPAAGVRRASQTLGQAA